MQKKHKEIKHDIESITSYFLHSELFLIDLKDCKKPIPFPENQLLRLKVYFVVRNIRSVYFRPKKPIPSLQAFGKRWRNKFRIAAFRFFRNFSGLPR